MENATLTIPTVHLNGTSSESLLSGYIEAIRAVKAAIQAVTDAAPHGRDYYVQSDAAYTLARDEHVSRMTKLLTVVDDLEALALAVSKQTERQ